MARRHVLFSALTTLAAVWAGCSESDAGSAPPVGDSADAGGSDAGTLRGADAGAYPPYDAGAFEGTDAGPDELVSYPMPDWPRGSPAEQGLDAAGLDEAAAVAAADGSFCLLVIRHGVLVYERYFGDAGPEDTHPSWSIAKSYSATLVGIAIDRGEIHALDDSVADYLPEWAGTDRADITVRDLVSMTSGLTWSSFQDYVEMTAFADDQSAFALGLAPSEVPGSSWVYHNGAVQVLEPLMRAATGMTLEEYAEAHLWSRIGMHATWAHDRAGHPTAYANVLATCRDHARLGYLYLHGGRWGAEQVVSSAWVRQALTPSQPYNRAYGLLFWLNGERPAMDAMMQPFPERLVPFAPPDLFAARGFGNQFVDVLPSRDLVVVRFGADPTAHFDPAALASDTRFIEHDAILAPILAAIREP